MEELRHLEARAALLRQETGMADPRELDQRFALSADLREAILQQDLVIANSQSAFTGFSVRTPSGRSADDRRYTMIECRAERIADRWGRDH